jgi:hypothetical protein
MLLIIASGCRGVCGNAALETRSKVVATTIAQKVTRDNKGRWTDCRMTMLLFVLTDNRVASTPRRALLVFSRAPLDAPVANLQNAAFTTCSSGRTLRHALALVFRAFRAHAASMDSNCVLNQVF